MSDQNSAPDPRTAIGEVDIQPRGPGFFSRLSVVWLVPVLALAVSLGVAWKNYSDRGTLIEISFNNAAGITPGQTVLKYRDVSVGLVEDVSFTEDLSRVLVAVRVERRVVPFLDDEADFWVVRPQVSVRGITGLDTVLSGVFIEGSWDNTATETRLSFTGLDEEPLSKAGQKGRRIVFRMRDGNQMAAGAPILFRGIQVGQVEKPRLSPAGDAVLVDAFVEAPYDQRITSATRFWDTSGFSIKLGAGGVTLDVNSLASLVEGGVSFDTLVSGGDVVDEGHMFEVYEDEASARESVFDGPRGSGIPVSILFDGSVNGLSIGADVRYRGIRVGEVIDLGTYVELIGGRPKVRLRAEVLLRPGRLGAPEEATEEEAVALLAEYVEAGLRARLASAGLLSGTLIVDLVELPAEPFATLDMSGDPFPLLPSVPAEVSDFNATAEGVLERINSLPIEELMSSAIDLLDSLDVLANDPALRKTPESALALLDDARAYMNSEDAVRLPSDLRAATNELRDMIGQLEEGGLVTNLLSAIKNADAAMVNAEIAAQELPEISVQLKELAEKANGLAMEELITSARSLVETADKFIGSEDAEKLPPALTAALDEIAVFLGQVREGGAIENANSAISAAENAANAVATAAEGLPELSKRLNGLVGQAEAAIGSYGEKSRFNREIIATLRDIQQAADALSALARTIQRNPNSLITGR